MKTFVLTAAVLAALSAALPARAIEVVDRQAALTPRHPDLAATAQVMPTAAVDMSELPEPEVFAMMLLGLVLIGYRASRDNNEKFK